MSEGDQVYGVASNFNDMIPIPIISNNQNNKAFVFNKKVQTISGIATGEGEILEFKAPALLKQSVQVGFNANSSDFFPMPLPSDPLSLNVPAMNSIETIQTTDLMIAKNGL